MTICIFARPRIFPAGQTPIITSAGQALLLQVFHCLENFLNTLFYNWQILLRDLPHRIDIHTHIIVNQHVAQPGNAAPWDLRMLRAKLLGQPFGCLAYDFKLANDGVLPMRGGDENIMTHGDIGFDFSMASKICVR